MLWRFSATLAGGIVLALGMAACGRGSGDAPRAQGAPVPRARLTLRPRGGMPLDQIVEGLRIALRVAATTRTDARLAAGAEH